MAPVSHIIQLETGLVLVGRAGTYRLKDHATVAGKEDKNKKIKSKFQRPRLRRGETFDRRTGELNGAFRFCSFDFAAGPL